MTRYRMAGLTGLSLAVLMTAGLVANALMIAPRPPAQRAVSAETIVVGKVTRIEDKSVFATTNPKSPQEVEYTVAVVQVEKAIKGAKGATHVRVAFIKPRPIQPRPIPRPGIQPGIQPVPIRPGLPPRGRFSPQLTKGQEVCLFLTKHHKENFYTFGYDGILIGNGNKQFKAQVSQVENALKVMANPMAALKAKKLEDRLEAAGLLLGAYNAYPPNARGKVERVSIGADKSKLIAQSILEADWNVQPKGPFAWQSHPRNLFSQMRPNEFGYQYPRNIRNAKERDAHMKNWLKANMDKVDIKKFAAPKAAEK